MNERRVPSFVLIVTLFCILVTVCSEASLRIAKPIFGHDVVSSFQQIDEGELFWLHRGEELEEITENNKIFYFYIPQTTGSSQNKVNPVIGLLTNIIHKATVDLPSQVKHALSDSLNKESSPSYFFEKEAGLTNWLIKWCELLSDWSNDHRRYLSKKILPKKDKRKYRRQRRLAALGAAQASDSVAVPNSTSASLAFPHTPLYLVPSSSPTLSEQPSVKAPEPSFSPVVKKSPPPLPVMRHRRSPPSKPSHHKTNNKESNIAAIAAGCAAAFALIAFFLFCCCFRGRKNKVYPKDGHRDDRPLLKLCSSNLSSGSSRMSSGFGNSSNKDFNSIANVNNGNCNLLPLPPGRVAPPTPKPAPLPPKPAPPPEEPSASPPPPAPKPPAPPPPKPPAPRAPPPPKIGRPPPNPPKPGTAGKASLTRPNSRSSVDKGTNETGGSDSQKAKLKPFFWDKVLTSPDQSMVWNEIKAGSFQFNEEMMENLFGYKTVETNKNDQKSKKDSAFEAPQYIQIIEAKKAQNLSILLKALNVTSEEVCDAITEGNELPTELIENLIRMQPTQQEELKLRLYVGDLSQLTLADRFLKSLVEIPFAFKRLESLLFMCSVQDEVSSIKESLSALEVACTELKNSRLFLKLLEAVLKTGNRMNDGTFRGGAQAFKLDTLLKLSDVKGTDGKTTLLHFVVLEIIRSEGIRAARRERENRSIASMKTEDMLDESSQESPEYYHSLGLQVVSNLSNELANVKKAALVDGDSLTGTVTKLGLSLKHSKDFLNNEMGELGEASEFRDTLSGFVQQAEDDIIWILEEEKRITSLIQSTADYFHGTKGREEGLRLFMIVRDFLVMVDKVCQEVKKSTANPLKTSKKEVPNASPSQESHQAPSRSVSQLSPSSCDSHQAPSRSVSQLSPSPSRESHQPPSPNVNQILFPAIKDLREDDSSSDDSS